MGSALQEHASDASRWLPPAFVAPAPGLAWDAELHRLSLPALCDQSSWAPPLRPTTHPRTHTATTQITLRVPGGDDEPGAQEAPGASAEPAQSDPGADADGGNEDEDGEQQRLQGAALRNAWGSDDDDDDDNA